MSSGSNSQDSLPKPSNPQAPATAAKPLTAQPLAAQPAPPSAPPTFPKGDFEGAVLFTLVNEGGLTDNAEDSGGITNYGLTKPDISGFYGRPATDDDVRNLTLAEAKEIYKALYWDPAFEQIFRAGAMAIFDFGVLHGTHSAKVLAQRIANTLGAEPQLDLDGALGPESIVAINKARANFVPTYAQGMKNIFQTIVSNNHQDSVFLAGWDNRADRVAHLS